MTLLPDPIWPVIVLAVTVFGDGLLTFRPPRAIAACLDGVGFPRDWWWVIAVVKFLSAAGLVAGIWVPGVGAAASAGLVAYFACAAAAHLLARYVGRDFWLNCLGMLIVCLAVFVICFLV
ncbi:DoxX family protein [Brevibacterium oceani]|uniref:DoxX family protein n=1 Tax=Brevibacterium oceani TaxID=358099 RepID=UPI0015E75B8E|nr:DoxX family protein [Brevibacterium oceani]